MKTLRLTVDITVSNEVEKEDIIVIKNVATDGFTITRTSRLGDIANDFFFTNIKLLDVEKVKIK